jgi:hypothetical protein
VGAGPGQLAPEDAVRLMAETWRASGAARLAEASLTLVVAREDDVETLSPLVASAED